MGGLPKGGGWGGENELDMPLMELVSPTFNRKVIFLIFKELLFLEEMFSEIF